MRGGAVEADRVALLEAQQASAAVGGAVVVTTLLSPLTITPLLVLLR